MNFELFSTLLALAGLAPPSDRVIAGRWKFYRFVNEYVWPTPLDKPNIVTGRIAADCSA